MLFRSHSYTLFHRFNYFCDLIGFTDDSKYVCIEEIPLTSIRQFIKDNWKSYFTVKYAYHLDLKKHDWEFPKVSKYSKGDKSLVIHPILTSNDNMEIHIPEDPWNDFTVRGNDLDLISKYLEYIEKKINWSEVQKFLEEYDEKILIDMKIHDIRGYK